MAQSPTKIAAITGAASGIGLATSKHLIGDGHTLMLQNMGGQTISVFAVNNSHLTLANC